MRKEIFLRIISSTLISGKLGTATQKEKNLNDLQTQEVSNATCNAPEIWRWCGLTLVGSSAPPSTHSLPRGGMRERIRRAKVRKDSLIRKAKDKHTTEAK